MDAYRMVSGTTAQLNGALSRKIIGLREHKFGFEGLIKKADISLANGAEVAPTDLENIMIHIERE